jgi:hypothetical protein
VGSRSAGFGGSVVVSAVATVLLLVAITGARRPASLEARGAPPWPAPASGAVAAGVHAAGLSLPAAGAAGTAAVVVTRYAVHVDVLVNGRVVPVPAGIGVDQRYRAAAPLTTSDGSGIVHVASGEEGPSFTLGQFFDEWQVALAARQLGGLRGPVGVSVNGSRVDGDPGAVVLAPHQQIAVSYGTGPAGPAGYHFPAGT